MGQAGSGNQEISRLFANQQHCARVPCENNVFCRMDNDDVKFRVVDWDWAGTYGTAGYPLTRNPEAHLPGSPGHLIHFGHDYAVLWKYFKQAENPSIE
jgi:hypothetical protein